MAAEVIYSDRLVEITKGSILFRNYYFPFGSKRVVFSNVDNVVAKETTVIGRDLAETGFSLSAFPTNGDASGSPLRIQKQ